MDRFSFSYPLAERSDVAEKLHGIKIGDPYRWLEDIDNPKAAAWVSAQNALTEKVLANLDSRAFFAERLAQLWALPRPGVPFERGGRWFQRRGSGPGSQPDVLYVMDEPGGKGRVLLDPATMSADGAIAVAATRVSPDGSLLAYATGSAGSDWLTWRIREVASGLDLGDVLERSYSAEWRPDSSGFYYARASAAGGAYTQLSDAVMFHPVGGSQDSDQLVLTLDDSGQWPEIAISGDGRYLIVSLSRGLGSGEEIRVLELARPSDGWQLLIPEGQHRYAVVGANDGTFYLMTDDAADRCRIVAVDIADPACDSWREVVAEAEDALMEAHFFGGRLVCHYLRHACSLLRVYRLDGTPEPDIAMPAMSTLSGRIDRHEAIEGTADSGIVHFQAESYTSAPSLWRHDLDTGETTLVGPAQFSLGPGYVTERVFVEAADGTKLPLFLTRRRDLAPDGTARVLLYGYGGVGIAITPHFSPTWAAWVEHGGMLAVASLRGGGEYGRSWYDAGRLARKQQSFDDFCACARWLATSGWSSAERIAISGGSSGGLLVGACLTQHPEQFGAAVASVGVFDMLRFHHFTDGWTWKTEYGDPDDPEQFTWLHAYSPLHNARPASYPATLLTAGWHDNIVVPGHSLKFAATLQAAQTGTAPILLRVESSAGHGHATSADKAIAEAADCLAFI
ncbi:MAG: S9 family peptidase, partial [Actinobacteria bacterium]|nr:S9 family peptidase [Actinomycetota bacterium]